MARALRKWTEDVLDKPEDYPSGMGNTNWPCDRNVVFEEQHPDVETLKGQRAQHKGVMTVWRSIEDYFEGMATVIRWSDHRFAGLTPEELVREALGT